jgi:transcription elongation GreA/GreB family factor
METFYFYRKDLIALEKRLHELKDLVKKASQETSDAAGLSVDWHDNFGYEQGQRDKEMWSSEYLKLKAIRDHAQLIDDIPYRGIVTMGRSVTIQDKNSGEILRLKIGSYMLLNKVDDMSDGYQEISYSAPLAQLIMLGEEGQERTGDIGGESKTIKILKIE